MNNVKINSIKENDESFKVEVEIDGKEMHHAFPKKDKYFLKDKDGVPNWIKNLINRKDKIDRRNKSDKDLEDKTLTVKNKSFTTEKIEVNKNNINEKIKE